MTVLHGCSESQPDNEQLTVPNRSSITLWIGETYDIILNAGFESNKYILKSDNPEIASAGFAENDNKFYINTFSDGVTSIRLIDSDNDKVVNEISVTVLYFSSEKIEETYLHPNKSEVFVTAQDVEVQKIIENELWKEIKERKFSVYTFSKETKRFTMDVPQLGAYYEGIYEWDINFLTLKYDNTIEKYAFEIAVGRNGYIIQADKTNEYQLLYPKAGITEVKMNRVWHDCDILTNIGGLIP